MVLGVEIVAEDTLGGDGQNLVFSTAITIRIGQRHDARERLETIFVGDARCDVDPDVVRHDGSGRGRGVAELDGAKWREEKRAHPGSLTEVERSRRVDRPAEAAVRAECFDAQRARVVGGGAQLDAVPALKAARDAQLDVVERDDRSGVGEGDAVDLVLSTLELQHATVAHVDMRKRVGARDGHRAAGGHRQHALVRIDRSRARERLHRKRVPGVDVTEIVMIEDDLVRVSVAGVGAVTEETLVRERRVIVRPAHVGPWPHGEPNAVRDRVRWGAGAERRDAHVARDDGAILDIRRMFGVDDGVFGFFRVRERALSGTHFGRTTGAGRGRENIDK